MSVLFIYLLITVCGDSKRVFWHQNGTEPPCCDFLHIRHFVFPLSCFSFCPPSLTPSLPPCFLLILSSPSMTSVERTSFPASSLSTRTRRRASRKQAMWTVSMTEKCSRREIRVTTAHGQQGAPLHRIQQL